MTTVSRRSFVTGLAEPLILGAQNKSGSAKPVIGDGEHRYEVTHDWGELPANIQYGNTHGVCEDSQGNIYVHHTVNASSESSDTMVIFDPRGRCLRTWGAEFKGGAHGLHIRKEGRDEFLYLCDTKNTLVTKRTVTGEEVWTIRYPEPSDAYKPGADGKKKAYSPTNVAIAPNGDIYVGDGYGSSYINQYNSQGGYIRTFGGKGKEAGMLDCPHGLIVDTRGKEPVLLVADRGNARLQQFTLDGQHTDLVGETKLPCNFHFYRNGDTVIPDLGARVTLLSRKNEVIPHLGDNSESQWRQTRKQPRESFTARKFVCPHGACFDHAGNIFVVEWVEVGRVTKLRHVS